VAKIKSHSEETYPNECCGALLGKLENSVLIYEIRSMKNINKTLPKRRYDIDPLELITVEKEAESKELDLVGIYHSHPEHPSRPSQYDLDHAWPNFSYMIVSVTNRKADQISSWRLDTKEKKFIKEQINIIEEEHVLGDVK
jgi:proteasome lid subunit RPN8/RPN11